MLDKCSLLSLYLVLNFSSAYVVYLCMAYETGRCQAKMKRKNLPRKSQPKNLRRGLLYMILVSGLISIQVSINNNQEGLQNKLFNTS